MTNYLADITAYPGETKKTFLFRMGEKVELTRGEDNQWRDAEGTIYALVDRTYETDTETRLGVGIISLPEHWGITLAARYHDYAYSSPTYEMQHERSEADSDLERNLYLIAKEDAPDLAALLLSKSFHEAVRDFGSKFWDTTATDDTVRANDGIDDV